MLTTSLTLHSQELISSNLAPGVMLTREPAATTDKGVPNHQNQQSCQTEHAALSSGVEHVFLPTSKEDIMSYANGFQRLMFNWFIIQHTDCLNYLKLES